MHMKIEYIHPENNSAPSHPPEIFQTPEQTQHHGYNPKTSQTNFKHFRKHLHPSKNI